MEDNNILIRWKRAPNGDYVGSYTHKPEVSGIGVGKWAAFVEVTSSLAGWTAIAAYLHPCDRMDYSTLREAKADARWRLVEHLRSHRG